MKDLFILHADADRAFTRAYLVPALGFDVERDRDRLLLSSELPPGVSVAQAIEAGVADSRVTVAVVSPAFLNDGWSVYGETLAGYHATRAGLLVPLLLSDCAIPLRLDFRVKLDCRDEGRRADEVRRLRDLLDLPAPVAHEIPCPYPGLRPYAAENAALFCGRDGEVDDLVSRIAGGCRELYVVGPSGSGKSSLLLSGVVPRLGRASPVVGEAFAVRVMRPGEAPVARLAAAIASFDAAEAAKDGAANATPGGANDGAPAARRVVVIDQLEEVFTLANKSARHDFFVALDELRKLPGCHLALVVRADFLGALMSSALWPHVRRSHRHEVEPLRGEALQAAITLPARRVGVELEPGLLDRLLDDAAGEPGSLPLIQEALVHLWAKRDPARDANLLTEAAYVELGGSAASGGGATSGLAAALSRRADTALAELDDADQGVARRLFLRLVSFGEGRADTRRQQPLAALRASAEDPRVDATARHLIDRRLLTADGDETSGETLVDLAHETLIVSWAKLRAWIAAYRKNEQRRRKLEDRAAEWAGHVAQGHRTVGLLDVGQLAEVRGWLTADTTRDLGLSTDVDAFIAVSQAAIDTQVAADRARQRSKRLWMIVGLMVLASTVVTSTLAVIAIGQYREARAQEKVAKQQEKIATEQKIIAEKESARANKEALKTKLSLGRTLLLNGRGAEAAPYLLAARADGADEAGATQLATLFGWATRYWPRAVVHHPSAVVAVAWGPDGLQVATASVKHEGDVKAEASSPDGKWDATARDKTVRLLNRSTGEETELPHTSEVVAVAWNSTSTRMVTASGHIAQVWDLTGKPVRTLKLHQDNVLAVAWSPDGTRIATASEDKTARIWIAETGRQEAPRLGHKDRVIAVAWSPDGDRVATASQKTARIWDARTGHPLSPPLEHEGKVQALAWSPDYQQLATASDRTTMVWSAPPVFVSLRCPGAYKAGDSYLVAWAPDGTPVATVRAPEWLTQARGASQLVDNAPGVDRVNHSGALRSDKTAHMWNAQTGYELTCRRDDSAGKTSAVGAPIATAGTEWRWRPLTSLPPDHVVKPEDGPDGMTATTSNNIVQLRVTNSADTPPLELEHEDRVIAVAWDPHGSRVATASNKMVRVWDPRTGQPLSRPLMHESPVIYMAWSPDGRRLATVTENTKLFRGSARLWDVSWDLGTPVQWRDIVERGPYQLKDDRLVKRVPPPPPPPPGAPIEKSP